LRAGQKEKKEEKENVSVLRGELFCAYLYWEEEFAHRLSVGKTFIKEERERTVAP